MGRRLWDLALLLGFACGIYLVVVSRHASDLRANARAASQWRPGDINERRLPTSSELAVLTPRARFMIDAQCTKEGGDPFAMRNCYAEAASWMLEEARDQETARDTAYLILALAAGLTATTLVLRRRRRNLWA